MSTPLLPRITAEEYLSLDRAAEWKSEFRHGEMFAMEAFSHAAIGSNVSGALRRRLRSAGCALLAAPLRLRISPEQFLYPDFQIIRGRAQLTDENEDTIMNSIAVIGIRSPSDNKTIKFDAYRRPPSLEEYVIISQSTPMVEVFSKQTDHVWSLTIANEQNPRVHLHSVNIEIPLAEFYDGVDALHGAAETP